MRRRPGSATIPAPRRTGWSRQPWRWSASRISSTKKVADLSGGEKALVALAAACAGDPEVFVLDEADSHLDGVTAERVRRVVQESAAAHVLWCTQSMDTAATADYVLFMENGRVRHHGTPEEVFAALEETCFYPTIWRVCR